MLQRTRKHEQAFPTRISACSQRQATPALQHVTTTSVTRPWCVNSNSTNYKCLRLLLPHSTFRTSLLATLPCLGYSLYGTPKSKYYVRFFFGALYLILISYSDCCIILCCIIPVPGTVPVGHCTILVYVYISDLDPISTPFYTYVRWGLVFVTFGDLKKGGRAPQDHYHRALELNRL
jgi:hypothetical protein